jgi:uncharacterized membrane protein
MPFILELFLSKYVVLILAWIYLIGSLIVVFGFKLLKIQRRIDVKFRGSIMHGTFIFLAHSIGIMVLSIFYLFLLINSVELTTVVLIILLLISAVVSNVIYVVMSNYLWDRLAINRNDSLKLSLYSLIIVTPWYYILNFV